MAKFTSPLDNVRVASPCPVNWDDMNGNEKVRFCGQCQLNVYNLSGMTRREAEDTVSKVEGRLCVRYYKRADGSIITQNCPVGLKALKRRISRAATAFLSAVIGFFGGLGFVAAFSDSASSNGERVMGIMAERHVQGKVAQPKPEEITGDVNPQMIQGGLAEQPPVNKQSSPKRSHR